VVTELSPAPLLPATERALLQRIATAQAEGRTPSLVAAVVRDGQPVWIGARGDVGPDPGSVQYRIGSLTKTFVAVQVLRLRDEGRLELSDRIDRHLPDAPVGHLTVAQLLAHTGGLRSEPPGPWWERTPGALRPDLPDVVGEHPGKHPPGRRFHYSNPGFAILGAVVERLRDTPWEAALRAEVLDPLGMSRTAGTPVPGHADGWAVHPWADVLLPEPREDYGPMAPAGQLWSTVADLCRFAGFLIAGDERVLSAQSVAEMRAPAAPADDPDSGYGLGLQLLRHGGRQLVGHTGSVPGFLATLWASPEADVGAVALANVTAGPAIGALVADLASTVIDNEPHIPDAWRPLADADPALLELVGPWYWGPTPMLLRLGAGRELSLSPVTGGGRRTALRPEPDGTWTGLDGYFAGETLRVVRDTAGTVSHLDLGTFVLTRAPYGPDEPVPGGVDPDGWRSAG
jgi:CubicO group peptidase (beta-lactamase class C family)